METVTRQPINLSVLGLEIAFRPGADMERAARAARLLEERYNAQKEKSRGPRSKDIILIFLALGLADELLQMKMKQEQTETRLQNLLAQIEKTL